jgi:WD40 repeat protein
VKALQAGDPVRIGDFTLQGRLGAGGMGRVYVGVTPGGRKVAVKLVRPEYAEDENFRERFAREIEAARRVGGFHTAQVVDADPYADVPWMALAYIQGPSLGEAVATGGTFDQAGVLGLGASLAEGLSAIHGCGLIHRDLKPGNVILADDGPRIVDFGLAYDEAATTLTIPGTVMGTPAYMSPEQHGGLRVTPATDVFCLGAVLVFAGTGHGPFSGVTTSEIRTQVLTGKPDLTGLAGPLRDIIARCLAKRPDDRPDVRTLLSHFTAQAAARGPVRPQDQAAGGTLRRPVNTASTAGYLPTVAAPAGSPKITFGPDARPLDGLSAGDWVESMAFSPDGRVLAASFGNNRNVRLWDTVTGHVAVTLASPLPSNYRLTFSADGRFLLAASAGSVVRWDIASGRPVISVQVDHASGLTISPDGRFAAAGKDKNILVWDTGREPAALRSLAKPTDGNLKHATFSPDGHRLAAAIGREVRTWDTDTLAEAAPPFADHPGEVAKICLSPDGCLIVTVSGMLARVGSGRPRVIPSVRLWDTAERHPSAWCLDDPSPHPDMPEDSYRFANTDARFSPDGRVLAVIARGQTSLWDLADRKPLGRIPVRGQLRFSPDGTTFATTSDGTVRLWRTADLLSPAPVLANAALANAVLASAVLADPAGSVNRTVFSPGWSLMATASRNRHEQQDPRSHSAIRLWRSQPGA